MAQADGTPGVQKISVKHEEIMNHLMLNPTHQLGDVARHFGLTQAWLSCIIHSEAFQARLAEKKEAVFNGTVLPIKEKLAVLAHKALDQLETQMPVMKPETVAAIADSTLDRLGYGSKVVPQPPGAPAGGGSVTINIGGNLRDELIEARRLIGARSAIQPALEVIVDGQPAPLGIGGPKEVPQPDMAQLREAGPAIPLAGNPSPGPAIASGAEV